MNLSEMLYLGIGLIAALVAGRLGIPLPGIGKPSAPNGDTLRAVVRELLIELLQSLSQPQPDPNATIREKLREIVTTKG